MATIQLEPGSKTVTARLDNGVVMNVPSTARRLSGASHIIQKPYQTIRLQFPGYPTTYTFVGTSKSRNIALPAGTTLAYRSK